MVVGRSLPSRCRRCGAALYQGFARCQNPECRAIREEFQDYGSVVVDQVTACIFSGAPTDVQLPNGDSFWAPYFLDMVAEGLIGSDLTYTEAFYKKYPQMKT
jgi:hypothetical protein